MGNKCRMLDGRIVYGNFTPKPKPKLKELNNGNKVMVSFTDNTGTHIENCLVLEVCASKEVVVSFERAVWPTPDNPAIVGQTYAHRTVIKRVKQAQVLAWASEWDWHAKVVQGNPYWNSKIIGLVDPLVLDQMAMV